MASDIHQVNKDLNLAPVLDLRPLRKSLRVRQGQPPPAWGPWNSAVGQSLRESSGWNQ